MHTRRLLIVACMSAAIYGSLGGCPGVDPRTTNQGGGSLISAIFKVNRLTGLTPDEVQIVTDLVITQTGNQVPALSDGEAEAVVNFLQDNGLNTIQDVEALVQNPQNVVISDEVAAALQTFLAGLAAGQQQTAGNTP